ncbi:MAG: SoxR reducing system RseC family protein [Clostridia bacterium]|nr:SoxR reducing system RseC family protein [Clostridia bacterium]
MTQTARVTATDGEFATVEVSRKTICEGCHNMSGSKGCSACLAFGDKHAQARAYNSIGAVCGDRVVVSASSKKVIGYSAAIFFLPIIAAFALYFLTEGFAGDGAVLYALAGFVISFAIACLVLEKTVKKRPDLVIVAFADENGDRDED